MPSRDDGFAIMDVSTSICDDPKFRRIARERPELVGTVFTAYMATMAESWRGGRRVSIEDAWPAILPYSADAAAIMVAVGLLDRRGVLSPKAWRGWFEPARSRRDKSRADWRKWQQDHRRNKGGVNPDSDPDTSIPSVPTVRPSVPTEPSSRPSARARGKENGLTTHTTTTDDAIRYLDAEYTAGRIDADEYHRQRGALTA